MGEIQDIDGKFKIDLNNELLTATDRQATPVVRVRLGKVGAATTDYGLEIFDQAGVQVFSVTGLGINSVGTLQIQDGAITTPKIFAGAVTADRIAANTITAAQIAANTITAVQIVALTITAAEIAAATITAAKLNVAQLSAISADIGTVTTGTIQANVVIAAEKLTAANIAISPTETSTTTVKLLVQDNAFSAIASGASYMVRVVGTFVAQGTNVIGIGAAFQPSLDVNSQTASQLFSIEVGGGSLISNVAGQTVFDHRAINVRPAIAAGTNPPTITTMYGVFVENITGGVNNFAIFTGSGQVKFGDDVQHIDGTAGSPSVTFISDTNTGLFRIGFDTLGFALGGIERVRMTTAGIQTIDGDATAPTYTFANDTNVGLYRITTDTLGITTGSVERVRISNTVFALDQTLRLDDATALQVSDGTNTQTVMARDGTFNFGFGMWISPGQGLAVGGGEFGSTAAANLDLPADETLHLGSDGFVRFYANAQTWGNRVTADFNTQGQFVNANQFRARVKNSTGQTITTGATPTLNWDGEDFDVGALHDNVTLNRRIIIPTAGNGIWLFIANIDWSGSFTADTVRVNIRRGGTIIAEHAEVTGTDSDYRVSLSVIDEAADADFYDVTVFQNSGSNKTVDAASRFMAVRLW